MLQLKSKRWDNVIKNSLTCSNRAEVHKKKSHIPQTGFHQTMAQSRKSARGCGISSVLYKASVSTTNSFRFVPFWCPAAATWNWSYSFNFSRGQQIPNYHVWTRFNTRWKKNTMYLYVCASACVCVQTLLYLTMRACAMSCPLTIYLCSSSMCACVSPLLLN